MSPSSWTNVVALLASLGLAPGVWQAFGSEAPPVLAPGGPRAASGLASRVECSQENPRRGIARLSWTPARQAGTAQRVEVTVLRDGFATGQLERTAELPAADARLVWDQLHGQAIHHWRVLTLHQDGWVPSESASFEGPTCVADVAPQRKPKGD